MSQRAQYSFAPHRPYSKFAPQGAFLREPIRSESNETRGDLFFDSRTRVLWCIFSYHLARSRIFMSTGFVTQPPYLAMAEQTHLNVK